MEMERVRDSSVWRTLKIVFMGSALLFLINNFFGFDNALTVGEIPRWQLLIHLHAGSIGWITLSAIGFAIWMLTGNRPVDATYASRVRTLGWAAVVIFAGYIPNYWLAFSRPGGPLVALLPIFGTLAVLVLWVSAIYAISQLGRQEGITPAQLLITGALIVAAIGATVGMLLGLERAIGQFLPLPQGEDRVGAHAGMMDTYLFLVASGIIEWITREDRRAKASVFAWIQAVAWTVGATMVPIAFFTNTVETLLPIFGLTLLLGMVFFLVRVAWRAVLMGPAGELPKPWAFFATIWLVISLAMFLYAVSSPDFSTLPSWFFTAFAHASYVGMMTNVILGVLSVRSGGSRDVLPWGETTALWVMNLGLILFVTLKLAADIRLGAIVMGIGVVLGVVTMILRLRASDGGMSPRPSMEPPITTQ